MTRSRLIASYVGPTSGLSAYLLTLAAETAPRGASHRRRAGSTGNGASRRR